MFSAETDAKREAIEIIAELENCIVNLYVRFLSWQRERSNGEENLNWMKWKKCQSHLIYTNWTGKLHKSTETIQNRVTLTFTEKQKKIF